MNTYRELYFYLFRAVEQSVRQIEQQNFGDARELLLQAQRTAEDAVLSDGFQDE